MSNNPWDDIRAGINQARELERATEHYAGQMARLLRGKLHHCCRSDLEALKKEIADYNMHTRKWKNKP